MVSMIVRKTALPDVLILEPTRHGDSRGFFSESWNSRRMSEAGIEINFVQDNHSLSVATGTLRGLHFSVAAKCPGQVDPLRPG
jgi:dTDP-4-dehydrorhamnose 3,5-epimerase